jgi:glycosyltransferase involved in cell wall biosynthesis
MRIAFYAPLKPPDHPVPSGDRRVAQLFMEALRRAGHNPVVASHLRSYDGRGDMARQAGLAARGRRGAERLLRHYAAKPNESPALWFTYHLYHKAPDFLGPRVSAALAIPYIVAEASSAPKRVAGAWASWHRAVAEAIGQADAVIGLNPADRECVLPLLRDPGRWVALKPFLDAPSYAPARRRGSGPARLVVVAMMRPGDKLASYRVLGDALALLRDLPWTLDVIGAGPAGDDVHRALAGLGDRVVWIGALAPEAIAAHLARADFYVWPAINEAFGMALLEAQAAALPVVAGDAGGTGDIVATGKTGLLVPAGDAPAFAAAVRRLLVEPHTRAAFAIAARRKILAEHDIPIAADQLAGIIAGLERRRVA